MALAGVGQVYLWTKPTGPPPPAGGIVLYFRYVPNLYLLLLLFL